MSNGSFQTLASIEAVRPVFMIVMGVFLSIIAWRLAKTSGSWTARSLVGGALMLGFGYAVMMPMYEAKLIEPFSSRTQFQGSAASALGWHVVKLVVMNLGWLFFGIGMALHANILRSPNPRPRAQQARLKSPMNPFLESLLKQGLLFDALGIIGLGLIGLAAVKLSLRNRSWGGTMMAIGAIALLIVRLYVIVAPHVITIDLLCDIGPLGNSLLIGLPPIFLSMGLAGIVWGLWGHERWLSEEDL